MRSNETSGRERRRALRAAFARKRAERASWSSERPAREHPKVHRANVRRERHYIRSLIREVA